MKSRDVLIAGGGIGGITAALCFAQQGFTVRLFEQAPRFSEIGAGIQLSPNCTRVLHDLGLEAALSRVAFLPEGTEMRDWKRGNLLTSNPLGPLVRKTYGFPYYHIHRADLMDVLSEAARAEPRITLTVDARVDHVEQTGDGVTIEAGGNRVDGALLVGADGIHSAIRGVLFGAEAPTFTGHVAWRALVPTNKLPEGFVRPVTSVLWGPG